MVTRWRVPALLFLFALLTLTATPSIERVLAQDARVTIVGSVVDASSNPIANADVVLERDGRAVTATKSAADGSFRFIGLAPGTYRVRASAPNLSPLVRDVVLTAAVATVRLPLVLSREVKTVNQAKPNVDAVGEVRVDGAAQKSADARGGRGGARETAPTAPAPLPGYAPGAMPYAPAATFRDERFQSDNYAHVEPSRFRWTRDEPLSTFGADVDTASYANVRRFLSQGQLPPADTVRIEELVNYFHFDYPAPRDGRPIALTAEMADCPWAPSHKLVLVGARATARPASEIAGRNIVLLVDVSGSMSPNERLPLLKSAFAMFVDTLRPDDRLAIVTYAGYSGVALPSTPVRQRDVIQRAIAGLGAGGSTNGAQGIVTAYDVARRAYIPGGVNRVVLATDGDFNVGVTSRQDLLKLIERQRESGVFLSVLGVGTDNLKDQTMEMLADKGNGNYAYLDSLREARRVLISEADSTLETVAKDVKFQVEFNPAIVGAWKLVGYENRVMAAEDFNDDRKDGGELGAGRAVTMLYEIVPVGVAVDARGPEGRPRVDPLKYQEGSPAPSPNRSFTGEWLTVKARYKTPEGEVSDVMSRPVTAGAPVRFIPIASAIAEYGLLLRDDRSNVARWNQLTNRVRAIHAPGVAGDWSEFSELVDMASALVRSRQLQ